MGIYFNELRWKIIRANNLLQLQVTIQVQKILGAREIQVQNIVNEYDQEIPRSQTADKPIAPRGRATQQQRDTRNLDI